MAPFSNYISFLFFTTLLLPLQIIARDTQFFSKVTHFNNNNNNNVKETELPNKEESVTNKPEKQPVFIPETKNSYGLYGHDESSQLPPTTTTTTTNAAPSTTTTTYQPYKTEFEDTSNKYSNYNNDAYNTDQNEFSNTNNKYYNKDVYGGHHNELSDTKYTEGGYNYMGNQHSNHKYYPNNNAANDRYYYKNNNYNAAKNRYSNNNNNNNAANNRYNGERQGMSDTRFLEGGKYFYDVNYEKYNPTLYGDSSRGVNTNNWYNNRGNYYGNNNGYQNQEEFEDEQNDFEP
ncbi:protein E6-like [Gastrolobium bilobum]|uniref:protein E6-like n=1 Tax=Gastrolobium bilobum TaxID=150636 RepID=UPI002AAFA0B3|nr:protein E6-like [Gastrolobium bilobum]